MPDTDRHAEAPHAAVENIEAMARLENSASRQRTRADRIADIIADFTGTIGFVVLHLIWFGVWATINLGAVPGITRFDPYPFQLLCMIVSLEGVLLATFVLIKQNRMGYLSDRRAHLDLQINLLAEREVTRLLQVTEAVARHLGIEPAGTGTASDLTQVTRVETLVGELDKRLPRKAPDTPSDEAKDRADKPEA